MKFSQFVLSNISSGKQVTVKAYQYPHPTLYQATFFLGEEAGVEGLCDLCVVLSKLYIRIKIP